MGEIRVVLHGALGKMGQAVSAGLAKEDGITIVGGADVAAQGSRWTVLGVSGDLPLATSAEGVLTETSPDVLVDFTAADATVSAVRAAAERGVNFVVGTSGMTTDMISELEALATSHKVGGVVASNFALGAVLLMHLAAKAAPFFDYAEIIETHHQTKIDAPSGTAVTTAQMMAAARGKPFQRNVPEKETVAGTRGGDIEGVTVHSLRLPGTMAHQEVIFGLAGQTLSLRHDTINRDCYVPGIALAVRHVVEHTGLVNGLDRLLGL